MSNERSVKEEFPVRMYLSRAGLASLVNDRGYKLTRTHQDGEVCLLEPEGHDIWVMLEAQGDGFLFGR